MNTDAVNIKKGDIISHNSQIWQVVKTEHNFRGRGSAVIRLKLKNIKTGASVEQTSRSNEIYQALDISSTQMQFLYSDEQNLYFMDPRSFNQYQLKANIIGNMVKYFKQGETMYVLLYDDEPITIRPPQTVRLKVTSAQDAVKGDTATAAKKDIIVETGTVVKVPLFIKKDDIILVNPENGEYIERVNQ